MSIGPFWLSDIPTEAIEIDLERDDADASLTDFTSASVVAHDPAGVALDGFGAAIEDSTVVVSWPTATVFTTPGVYSVQVTLIGTGKRETVAPIRFVVQAIDGWHNLASARDEWADAPYDDVQLAELLDVAKGAVIAFAPVSETVPVNYRKAQLVQARNVWNAAKVAPSGDMGDGTYVITPRPLDWHVQQLLRPKKGVPSIW